MNTRHDDLCKTQVFFQCDDGDCAMFFYLEPASRYTPIYRRHVRVLFLGEKSYAPAKSIVTVYGASDDVTPQAELFELMGSDSFLPACERVIAMLRTLDIASEGDDSPFVEGEALALVVNAFMPRVREEAMAS